MTEKEQHSTTQHEETHSFHDPNQDEIRLTDLLEVLIRKKVLILAVTFVCTLVAIYYAQSTTPIYKATIGFLEPIETYLSVLPSKIAKHLPGGKKKINRKGEQLNITAYSLFLSEIESFELKKIVFINGDFFKKFYDDDNPIDLNNAVLKLHSSTNITKEGINEDLPDFDRPVFLEMTGSNPEAMSEFLTKLTESAIEKVRHDIINLVNIVITAEMNKIFEEIGNLNAVENEKTNRALIIFSEAAVIAKNLGIKNNNFDKLQQSNFNLGITTRGILSGITEINSRALILESTSESEDKMSVEFQDTTLPFWFLYGEEALQLELNKLASRKLQIPVVGTDLKKMALKSYQKIDVPSIKIKVAILNQPSIPPTSPIKPNKKKIILIGMVLGLFIGILIVFLSNTMDELKKKQLSSPSTAE